MAGIPWTSQEVKILKELVEKRKMPQEIRRILKSRSAHAITQKAYTLNLHFAGQPEIDLEEYKAMMKVVKA